MTTCSNFEFVRGMRRLWACAFALLAMPMSRWGHATDDSATSASAATATALGMIDDAVSALAALRQAPGEALTVERPARHRLELGAVIDPAPADGGPPEVLALTPGRAGARMGLAVGDRIVAIDGKATTGNTAATVLREALAASAGTLELEVVRAGRRYALAGELDRVAIPAYRLVIQPEAGAQASQGCGRVSTFLRPPATESLYPAVLHEIDGRLYGALDSAVLRLPVGKHVLKISEAIDHTQFDDLQNRRRASAQRNERFKYLELEVEADTKYHLAVRFYRERIDPVHEQAYWEPVVWKRTHEPCS